MKDPIKYRSLTFNVFDVIRILIYGFVSFAFVLRIILQNTNEAFIYSSLAALFLIIILIGASYSEVQLSNNSIQLQNIYKTIHLKNVKSIKTWWAYDFAVATNVLGDGPVGETRGHANKINCYVKFQSEDSECFIYEQIHLGDKFPNNHPYLHDQIIDQSKMIKVWDIDNCLTKLNLSGFEIKAIS